MSRRVGSEAEAITLEAGFAAEAEVCDVLGIAAELASGVCGRAV